MKLWVLIEQHYDDIESVRVFPSQELAEAASPHQRPYVVECELETTVAPVEKRKPAPMTFISSICLPVKYGR